VYTWLLLIVNFFTIFERLAAFPRRQAIVFRSWFLLNFHLRAVDAVVFPLSLTSHIVHRPPVSFRIFNTLVPLPIIGAYLSAKVAGDVEDFVVFVV
jgi:hypothetical protein